MIYTTENMKKEKRLVYVLFNLNILNKNAWFLLGGKNLKMEFPALN